VPQGLGCLEIGYVPGMQRIKSTCDNYYFHADI